MTDPIARFEDWFAEAVRLEPGVPDAAALATVGASGRPSSRVVLVKAGQRRGFDFFTNYDSRKGDDLAANPAAALTYHWKSLGRSVRVEGDAQRLPPANSDAYWYSRPRASRISARISDQSRPVDSRDHLEARVREETDRIDEAEVERPANWGGYRLVPVRMEFWTHRDDRLHDRLEFTRLTPHDDWQSRLLQP